MIQTASFSTQTSPQQARLSFQQAQQALLRQGASCYITRSEFNGGKWRPVTALFVAYERYRQSEVSQLWLYDFSQERLMPCEALPEYWAGNAFGESLSQPAFSAKINLFPN